MPSQVPQALGAADRLLSFYGNELLARSGTLASVKSFGSQASAAPTAAGGTTDGRPSSRGRPDGIDVVIDPYELNSSDLESSSQSGMDSDAGRQAMLEPGDDTDWTASGYGDSEDLDDQPGDDATAAGSVPPSRQLRGGHSNMGTIGRSRAGSVAGGDLMSVGELTGVRSRGLHTSNSMRSRVSIAATAVSGAGRAGTLSNFASFKSRASTVAGGGGGSGPHGAGRDLISFKRRASASVAASGAGAAGGVASSFRSRASNLRPGAAGARGGGGPSSFKSRASTVAGSPAKGSIWTRVVSNNASVGGGSGAAGDGPQRRPGGAVGTPPMSVCSSRYTAQRGDTAGAGPKNRLSGKNVRRRLLRRRGWDFDITPGEIDFHLGRQLPDVLTRPQPTVNSEDEEEGDGDGSDDDDDDGSLSAGGDAPPPGPAVESIKTYAKERAPEVLWSERLRSAKLTARATGQTVTVRGRLDRKRRRDLARRIQKWDNREWFASRKRTPPAPPLHPAVVRVIEQWFALVDDDGSGTLDHSELLAALRASNVPVSPDNINEMIELMDLDGDGVINWKEFETFFMYEFAAGKNLLSGEYVLPSGVALPFGVMIAKLKRNKLLSDLTEGGQARAKWTQVADNPMDMEDELGMMAAVEMAMEEMKNPALARQRNRAAKALNRLPAHLRTKSMGRHLERHPEITEKLLRASSIAPFLLNTMKRCSSSTSEVMARLASAGSQGSANSSMAPSVVSGASNAPGNAKQGGRGRNVDLNVAAALAAGLEWPVNGANFYNRRARTILRSVCQRPAEALLRSQAAKQQAIPAKPVPGAAAPAAAAPAASGGEDARPNKDADKAASAAASAAAEARAAFALRSSSRRNPSMRNMASMRNSMKTMSRGRSRRRGSDDDEDEDGSEGGRPRRRSDTSDEVLPWLVNAKRREEEEREELRAQLQGGGRVGPGSDGDSDDDDDDSDDDDDDDDDDDEGTSAAGAGKDEEDVWVSPMLRSWLKQEHKLHRKRRSSGHRSLLGPGPEMEMETGTDAPGADLTSRDGAARRSFLAPKASDDGEGEIPARSSETGSGSDGEAAVGGGGAAPAALTRTTPRSRRGSGTGSLARRLLERSVHLPPELAALRDAGARDLPVGGEGARSAHSTESGFTSVGAEAAAAAAVATLSPRLTPTPSRPLLIPSSGLTAEASWGQSVETPTPSGAALETGLSALPPGTAPAEGKPRKPRRRMRFEDEEDVAEQTEATTDGEKTAAAPPGAGGLTAVASSQSLTALAGGVSPAGPSLQLRVLLPQQSQPYSEGRTISTAGDASAADVSTDGEDGGGGGGGSSRSSPGPAPRAAFLRSSLVPGSAPSADHSALASPRGSAASESGVPPLGSGPERSGGSAPRGGSRPRLSIFGPQELPTPSGHSGPSRHWSAVSGGGGAGGAPPPLLRGSTAQATLGASSMLDGLSGGNGQGDNSDEEPLDAEEAREMMAAMTLDLRKGEALYDIHNGHQLERPTTSQFRAALAKIRTAASALLQSHSLPPHPEYTSATAPPAAAVQPRPPSATAAGHSFLTARPPGGSVLHPGPSSIARTQSGGGAPSSNGTEPGAGGSGGGANGAGPRKALGHGRGPRAVKQVATRSRTLLISGVHMRASVSSVTGSPAPGGGGGAGAAARRRRPSSPSSRGAGARPRPAMRAVSKSSIGFSHTPGILPSNSEEVVLGGVSSASIGIPSLPSGEESYSSLALAGTAAAAAAAAAPGYGIPDARILESALATSRSASRSRPASRAKSPVSRTPAGPRPLSRVGSPLPNGADATSLQLNLSLPSISQHVPLASTMSAPSFGEASKLPDGSAGSRDGAVPIVPVPASTVRATRGRVSPRGGSPVPAPQPPEAWDAHVAAMLQRRTAAEMAAVQRSCMAGKGGHSPRDGATSPAHTTSPDTGAARRGGTTADGPPSARGPLVAGGVTSWRSGGSRSIGGTHAGSTNTGAGDGAAAAGAAAAMTAPAVMVDTLLGPAGTELPEYVPVPGAMPRLQSRYAPKRPAAAAAPVAATRPLEASAPSTTVVEPAPSGGSQEARESPAAGTQRDEGAGEGPAAAAAAAAPDGELPALDGDCGLRAHAPEAPEAPGAVVGACASEGPAGLTTRWTSGDVGGAEGPRPLSAPSATWTSEAGGAADPRGQQLGVSSSRPQAPAADATAAAVSISEGARPASAPMVSARVADGSAGAAALQPPPLAEESEASVAATSVAADVRSPRPMRLFTLSTEGSESPSRATSSDWYDESYQAQHIAAGTTAATAPQRGASVGQITTSPREHTTKLTLLHARDGVETVGLGMRAVGGGRTLSIDEALLMSGFGKPQTPALARIERGTSRVALDGPSRHHHVSPAADGFSQHGGGVPDEPEAAGPAPSASAAAGPSSPMALTANPYTGGAANFVLPAPSRLKITVPGLAPPGHSHHANLPAPPAPSPGVAQPQAQVHPAALQKPLPPPTVAVGPMSPRSLAATRGSASGTGSGGDAAAVSSRHAIGPAAAAPPPQPPAPASLSPPLTSPSPPPGAAGLSGRSRATLQPLALVPQPPSSTAASAATTATGEQIDGAPSVATSAAPVSPAAASPLPPVQAVRSQGHLPVIHQAQSPPLYHPHHHHPNIVYQQHPPPPPQQQSQPGAAVGGVGGGGGTSANVSVSGQSIGAVPRVPPLSLLQLPPLREPASPHRRGDSPKTAPAPSFKYSGAKHLMTADDIDRAAASPPPARRRSAIVESLPALPLRIHSQGNFAQHQQQQHQHQQHQHQQPQTRGPGGGGGGGGGGGDNGPLPRGGPFRAHSSGSGFLGPGNHMGPGATAVGAGQLSDHASAPHLPSAMQRRAAWGNDSAPPPPHAGIGGTAAAAAAFAPAPPAAPLVAPVVSSLNDLPDIVTLLLSEPPPAVRTGPIRVRKMDY